MCGENGPFIAPSIEFISPIDLNHSSEYYIYLGTHVSNHIAALKQGSKFEVNMKLALH